MQSFRKQITHLLFALVIISPLGIKLFVGEWAQIPSSSMSPTLLPNDWIWYNKYEYGAILPQRISEIPLINLFCLIPSVRKLDKQTTWKPYRLRGYTIPQRMDITIFRPLGNSSQLLIKRCVGLPGDTITIHQGQIYINQSLVMEPGYRLPCEETTPISFPSALKNKWTSNEYGPIIIPYKGMKISLDSLNIKLYTETINNESKSTIKNKDYTFENDYYFMMGDNRGNSLDSRFIGFIPEKNITGKTTMILFSKRTNGEEKYHYRMERFFKRLE